MADPKPAEAITEFTPGAPSDPSHADLTTEGMLLNLTAAVASVAVHSKSVKVSNRQPPTIRTIYVQSDQAGAFIVEVMLDESERSSGAAVWRQYPLGGSMTPIAVVANALKVVGINDLFRQVRITYTPTAGPAIVKAWFFSIP